MSWLGGFTTSTEGGFRIDTNASYLALSTTKINAMDGRQCRFHRVGVDLYYPRKNYIHVNQSINQSIVSMLINRSIDDRSSTKQSIDQSINQSTNQSINETHLMNTCLKWRLDWVGLFYHACSRPLCLSIPAKWPGPYMYTLYALGNGANQSGHLIGLDHIPLAAGKRISKFFPESGTWCLHQFDLDSNQASCKSIWHW